MINLTIHDSVFAVPAESGDMPLEKETIERYFCGIEDLISLSEDAEYSVFISRHTNDNLDDQSPAQNYTSLRRRIGKIKKEYPDFLKFPYDKLSKLLPADQRTKRNDIFGTFFFEDQFFSDVYQSDVVELLNNLTVESDVADNFDVPETLRGSFIRLLKEIANLNAVTHTTHNHFIIVNGNYEKEPVGIGVLHDASVVCPVVCVGVNMIGEFKIEAEMFETVEDACKEAKEQFKNLTFGPDVDPGIATLAADAGPPDRIYFYLEVLDTIAEHRNRRQNIGSFLALAPESAQKRGYLRKLGDILLIKSFGCDCGDHGASNAYITAWSDGQSVRPFRLHLRPSTVPSFPGEQKSRTVRIYFDWDDRQKKIVVGWIGKHPERSGV
jgi:hypothetical protein